MSNSHPTDEQLEDYSRYREAIAPERLAGVEEHLLVCERCREYLAEVDKVTDAIRQVLTRSGFSAKPGCQ